MSFIDTVKDYFKKPKLDFGSIKKKTQPFLERLGAEFKEQQKAKFAPAKGLFERIAPEKDRMSPVQRGVAGLGKFMQTAPEFKIPREKLAKPLRSLAGLAEFGPSMVGGAIRSYGKTLEEIATPKGRKEALFSLKRVLTEKPSLETLEEPAVRWALDIPDILPGGFLFAGGLKMVGKEAGEKIAREAGEKIVKELAEKGTREVGEKVTKEIGEKVAKEVSEKAFNVNLKRLKTTEGGERIIKEGVEKLKPMLSEIKGKTLSHKEVLKEAQRSRILQGTVTRTEQKAAESVLLKTRQNLVAISDEISKAGGKAPKEVWNKYMKLLKTVSSYATEKGRALEALKIGAEGKSVKDELIKEILKTGVDTDAIIKAAMGVDFDDANQAAKFYRKFIKPTIGEKLDFYRYVNMLSSPKTQIINILGNLFQAPVAVGEKLYAGGIDTIASVLTGKQKTHYVREVPQYTKGFINAIPEAIGNFRKAFKGETAIYRPDVKRMPVTTKGVGRAYGTVLRFMEGADVFFQTLFKSAATESETYKAIRMGKEVVPEAIEKLAEKEALYRIFRQPLGAKEQGIALKKIDEATKAVYSLRKISGVKWFVPFVQTPMAILKQGIEFSPLGATAIPGAADKITQTARMALGSTVMAGAGYLALQDRTTWSAPKGEKDKAYFYASGKKPYSIRIGDKWVQYSKLGPLAYPIAMAAALKEVSKDRGFDKKTSEVAKDVFLEMSKFFTDQSYLSGINDIMAIAEGEEYALEQAMANIPRQLIPLVALQGWVARTIDDIYRHPKTVLEKIKTGLPFLSKQVEPYRTPTGEVSRRDYPLFHAVSPITVGKIKPEFEGLYEARGKAKELRKAREDILNEIIIEGKDKEAKELSQKYGVKLTNEEVKRRAKAEALRLIGEGKDKEAKKIYNRFNLSISKKEAEEGKNLYQEIYKTLPKSAREAFIEWYEKRQAEPEFPGLPMGD